MDKDKSCCVHSSETLKCKEQYLRGLHEEVDMKVDLLRMVVKGETNLKLRERVMIIRKSDI